MKFAIVSILCAFLGILIAYYFFNKQRENRNIVFKELFMEGSMKHTPSLESDPEIQNSLSKMATVGLCGLIYNARVSQTMINAQLGLDCTSDQWLSYSSRPELGLASSTEVKKFAILPRSGKMLLVTEGPEGANTYDELKIGIPKIIEEAIQNFPKLKSLNDVDLEGQKKKAFEMNRRKEEIQKSFKQEN